MSEQDTETKENPEGDDAVEEKEIDHLSDLSELEKIKLELQKEKEIAAKELAAGEDEDEDLREVDYLQKLITLSVKFDHHVGMYLMPAYIDCGLKYDHRLAESYTVQITTIQSFLRLLEKVDGVTREEVTKQCILNLRNIIQLVFKNMVKPLYKEVGLMEESQKAYSKYEALMNASELEQAPGGDNPSNIPGGVSQTSKLATGGDMREDSAGLESLRDVSE